MLQLLIEYPDNWSDSGSLRLKGSFSGEVSVRPDAAQKTANAYLGLDVGMAFRSGKPVLVLGEKSPVWRMPIELHWYGLGKLASFGEIDVDAMTDNVIHLSRETITHESDCLAACSAMILDYLQIPFTYNQLLQLLQVEYYGSFFRNLQHLQSLGVYVQMGLSEIDMLKAPLSSGLPIIAYVDTGELTSYWNESTNHAVVISGIDEQLVTLNDPFFESAPKQVSIDEFVLAWDAQKGLFAILSLDHFDLGSSATVF